MNSPESIELATKDAPAPKAAPANIAAGGIIGLLPNEGEGIPEGVNELEGFGPIPDGDAGLLAASNALAFKSLSPPANIIPERVPVKKVATGIINSKNF